MRIVVTENNDIAIAGFKEILSIDKAMQLVDDLNKAISEAKQGITCCDNCIRYHSCERKTVQPISKGSKIMTCGDWCRELPF